MITNVEGLTTPPDANSNSESAARPANDDSITIDAPSVLLPLELVARPYLAQEAAESQDLLMANGFGESFGEWQRAAQSSSGVIATAALYLLTRQPSPENESLFRGGLENPDESVRALAAYGLVRLGDNAALVILQQVARLNPDVFLGATRAAGLLGELGEAAGYATILRGMDSMISAIRIMATRNLLPFVDLHGRTYAQGIKIDIWALYERALTDNELNVRLVARAQLAIIDLPEATELLARHPNL